MDGPTNIVDVGHMAPEFGNLCIKTSAQYRYGHRNLNTTRAKNAEVSEEEEKEKEEEEEWHGQG